VTQMSINTVKSTPLIDKHRNLGAKFTIFAGWEMPLYYRSVQAEHLATRHKCGIFDVSHMGKILLSGSAASQLLDYLFTNSINDLQFGHARYGFFCNHAGGIIDDLLAYHLDRGTFYLVVNAGTVEKVLRWIKQHAADFGPQVQVTDLTVSHAGIAIQGPLARSIATAALRKIFPSVNAESLLKLPKKSFLSMPVNNDFLILSATGYTGEDGFEVFGPVEPIATLWDLITADLNASPAGLGARDSLRLEAGLPLYGHEIDEATSPFEAGLGRFVKLDKGRFLGVDTLREHASRQPTRKLVFLQMLEPGAIPRSGGEVLSTNQTVIGKVTSGGYSPIFRSGIALAYVATTLADPGTLLQVKVRDRLMLALVASRPSAKSIRGTST